MLIIGIYTELTLNMYFCKNNSNNVILTLNLNIKYNILMN